MPISFQKIKQPGWNPAYMVSHMWPSHVRKIIAQSAVVLRTHIVLDNVLKEVTRVAKLSYNRKNALLMFTICLGDLRKKKYRKLLVGTYYIEIQCKRMKLLIFLLSYETVIFTDDRFIYFSKP